MAQKKKTLTVVLLAAMGAMLLALMVVLAQPRAVSAAETLVADKIVRVPESAFDVDTGVDVRRGDRLVVSASGQIWAGVAFTGKNGPQGWDNKDCANKFPLPCSYPYALLGKLNGSYFYIGSGIERMHNSGDSRLYLRINDDEPGNGSGSFTAHVQVFRPDAPPDTIPAHQCSDGKDNDGDGKIDFGTGTSNDPGCESATDTDETDSGGPVINTPPKIVPVTPAPDSKIKNRAPLISATVQDAETDLDGSTIKLFLDGSERTASYDKASDKLTYQSSKLARGQHTIRVEATDEKGLQTAKDWSFSIMKKR